MLTKVQRRYVEAIRSLSKNGRLPTIREISQATARTPNATVGAIRRLKRDGVIDYEPGKARTIRLVDQGIPLFNLEDLRNVEP